MASKKRKLNKPGSLGSLTDKYTGSGVASDQPLAEWEEQLWVPFTDPLMSYLTGGGARYGRIMEISGQESSGKTLGALDLIKNAQEMGGMGIFVDAELAFSDAWAELNGVSLDDLYIFQEMAIEVVSDFVAETALYYRNELTNNEPIVLVIDSVGALDTIVSTQTAKADRKAEMGSRAKALYEMIRLRNRLWFKLGVCVIFINQLRDKINTGFGSQFGEKHTTVGGNALKFFASQRVWLETKKQLTIGKGDRKRKYGVQVLLTMKKNKLAMPRVPTRIDICFDPNHDDLGFHGSYETLLDLLVNDEIIEKSGNTYSFGSTTLGNSKSAAVKTLEEDEDALDNILFEAKIGTVTTMKERLDEIDDNLYPIEGLSFAIQSAGAEEEDD